MKTRQLSGHTSGGRRQFHVIDPKSTRIIEVAEAGEKLLAAWPTFQKLHRERQAAHVAAQYAKRSAKADARNAGLDGTPFDAKKAKKKRQATKEAAEEADLLWEQAGGKIDALVAAYRAVLSRNAAALRDEAMNEAENAIRSLTTARTMADKAMADLEANFGVLGGMAVVMGGGDLNPKGLKAGGISSAPLPYIGVGIDNLSTAVGLAVRVLDTQRREVIVPQPEPVEPAVAVSDDDPAATDGWDDDEDDDDDE